MSNQENGAPIPPSESRRRRNIVDLSKSIFNYLFSDREYQTYQNPDLYEGEVSTSSWHRRENLARGVADVVEANFPQDKTRKILDIGAGTGILSLELASRGFSVTALDLFAEQLGRLQERARTANLEEQIITAQADMNRVFPFADDAFSSVVSLRATRYITDFDQFLSEVFRVLEPNGIFVLPVFFIDALPWKRHSRKGLSQETTLRRISQRITDIGFEIDQETTQRYLQAVDLGRGQREVPFYYRPTFIVARKTLRSS